MGRIERLWLKPAQRLPMQPRDELEFVAGHGIRDNADAGRASRQVTIIDAGRWGKVAAGVDPSARRANVMTSGIDLRRTRGRVLRLGEALVAIRGETRPCALLDDAHPGLRSALDADWGGGVHGIVLRGGVVRTGEAAELQNLDSPAESHRGDHRPAVPK